MNNQGINAKNVASAPPVVLPDDHTELQVPHPTSMSVARAGSAALQDLLARGVTQRPLPFLLAGEQVTSHLITLPPASTRQRAAMLVFAAEDRIAMPLDQTLITAGPVIAKSGTPQITFVVDRRIIDTCPDIAPRILPEYLIIARPNDGWAVWRDGDRCIVRAADGTGFAAPTEMLPLLWTRAGQPALTSLAMPLPQELPHSDLSQNVPPPDAAELAYTLPRVRLGDTERYWRPAVLAGAVIAAGLVAHLSLLALDVIALNRIANREQAAAQASIADTLPGMTLMPDVGPILARLTPTQSTPAGSTLLPLMADVAAALAVINTDATFRRLSWGAAEDRLVVLVQASGLEALQTIERGLIAAGLAVQSGAASAGDGAAEAEMRISRGPA